VSRFDGRFAPSPTGTLHLGNLRTALLAWLFARSQDARFLVRVEDLDAGRVRERFVAEQLADLAALGIDWDGEPVRQSARGALYEAAAAQLGDRVFRCWCTRAEVREAASAPHGDLPEGAYPGTCRRLTAAQVAERERSGRPAALRVAAGGERVAFTDRLHGRRDRVLDDFVIRRNDGAWAYNLATAYDDAEQGIGEVVRGDDLLDTTPRQVWVLRALGLPEPAYAHVPLVRDADGRRLAKRDGDVTLRGRDPDEARAWCAASVGLCAPGERPTAAELVERFDPGVLA
jgi:glutamyl-tRNA synthetase